MKMGTLLGVGLGAALLAGGGYVVYKEYGHGLGGSATSPGPSGGSISGGIPVTIAAAGAGTQVGGPSPGARGENLYPTLWAVAPTTLPQNYAGGPTITARCGTGWLVIAVDLAASGTFNGQPADAYPWIGVAEYTNGQLVRVYPQASTGTLGSFSGGYDC